MDSCSIARSVRVVAGIRRSLDEHARSCGDRVTGVALHPDDFLYLGLVEIWGLPVLAWDEVTRGGGRLLCDAVGDLIPEVHTVDDLLEHWAYGLEYSSPAEEAA